MPGMMENMPGWGVWGAGIWIAILVLIIVAIVYLIRYLQDKGREGRTQEETPLDILKKRYARGEIDRKEFEEKKRDLV